MSEYLYRRNTVLEVLRANRRQIYQLWLQSGIQQPDEIVSAAQELGVPIRTADKEHLSRLIGSGSHQGVIVEAGQYPYSSLDAMLDLAAQKRELPFLLFFDLLHGPQNIGALLRAAEACGVHGVILQDRRAPDITPSVVMFSAGATEHLLIGQVNNLVQTIRQLKSSDIWVVGMDISPEAQVLGQFDLNMALAIVLGHEGSGLRRLVREKCDFLLKLPMRGQVESLNVATAGAVTLYAAWQARGYEGVSE